MHQIGRIIPRPCRCSRLAGAFATRVAGENRRMPHHANQALGTSSLTDGSASAELARPYDFGVEPFDSGAAVMGIGRGPPGLHVDKPAHWPTEVGADQHPDAVDLDSQRKFVERAAVANPGVHVARAP